MNDLHPLDGAVGSCLRCYGPIHRFSGIAARCEYCGFVNTKDDQREFWTREPWLMRFEWATKLLVVPVACVLFLLVIGSMNSGTSSGWLGLLPLAATMVLWKTASLITRRRVSPSPRNVWMSVFFVLALLAFIFGNLFSDELLVTLGWLNLLLLGLIPLIAFGCLRFRIWRIQSGARTAVARHQGSAL